MNRRFLLLAFIIFSSSCIVGQKTISGVSEIKYVNISKDPPKPPYLEIVKSSLTFQDKDGDNKIGAEELTLIRLNLTNSGIGAGLGLTAVVNESNKLEGLSYNKELALGTLDPGKTMTIEIPISGLKDIPTSKATFSIKINEANGFGTDPVIFEVPTQAFKTPKLLVVDHKVSSQSGFTLEKRRPFDVEVLLQNTGQGAAIDVDVRLILPANVVCYSPNTIIKFDAIASGETKLITYNLIANNDYNETTLPLTVKLKEKLGKYAEDKNIVLTMNQAVSSDKLIVQGKDYQDKDIEVRTLTSAVDKNIPEINKKYPNRYALVIGNEEYSKTLNAEVNVTYARHDAMVFAEYIKSVMGVEEKNLFTLYDASSGTMTGKVDLITELLKKVGNDAELIFYYAGHGFPDEKTQAPLLIPVDVDASNLQSAIKLSDVLTKFSATGAKSVTIFLDACFSGGGRNQGLLAARQVKIKPQSTPVLGNMVLFTATSAEQVALPNKAEMHGMFTYFLLKKLQESKGRVTYGELAEYLKSNVGIESLRSNGKLQEPEVQASPSIGEGWKNWKF